MTGEVIIYSPGLWRLRHEVCLLSGLQPRRGGLWRRVPPGAAIAGWGHKDTAQHARTVAVRRRLAYLAFEDGFLRSLKPGASERPLAMVMDRSGIYYDARQSSDLEQALQFACPLDAAGEAQAAAAIDTLRRTRLSKFNHAPLRSEDLDQVLRRGPARRILVVDQTYDDASIAGGLADSRSFSRMVEAAITENPGARVIAKLHPEVVSGRKRGYLDGGKLPAGVVVASQPVNPWALLDAVDKVYTVSSQLGFEALLAGRPVVCFGMPFYAGWGLTDDRVACQRRTRRLALAQLVDAAYFRYCRYFDAWTRRQTDFFTAADQLSFLRSRFLGNSRPVNGYRITPWKRRTISRMLDGPVRPVRMFYRLDRAIAAAKDEGGAIAGWGAAAHRIAEKVRSAGIDLITVEDGFIRSVGLGASFTPALSYVFDTTGIYYDPHRPSELEAILETFPFDRLLIDRARSLIRAIVGHGLTKYNLAAAPLEALLPGEREVVLVPGQVADDEAVRLGGAGYEAAWPLAQGGANLALLRRVRARRPHAFIIYRPHPDVAAGLRAGKVPERLARQFADHIDRSPSIVAAMERADRVETLSSLAGFEALLRGKPVTVHGRPFYAGWGLTEDLQTFERRTRRLSLEELVAGALIVYPRYLDPVSPRPCPVEVAVERLAEQRRQQAPVAARLRLAAGRAIARSRYLLGRAF